jgi:hypothetical protein
VARRRLISRRFFIPFNSTAVIGIPIAIPENEDRIGCALDAPDGA